MSEIIENSPINTKDRSFSEGSDNEYDPQYKPVITLPEVEVSTNEENETELLKIRAKLYRFDSTSDPPEWKERGTGDIKLLKHKETSAVRVVMRRDKTLKVCANHFITPWMELKPKAGSEKAFVYKVFADFADEKPKSECLAIKFGTIENAKLFKAKFEEAKKIVTEECDLYNGKADEEDSNEESDDSQNDDDDNSACEEVIKKINELEVTNGKEKD